MDILSKDTLALLDNATLRETVEKVLTGVQTMTVTITAPGSANVCDGDKGQGKSEDGSVEITVRRLSL